MHYAVSCIDKAGQMAVRQANRAAHLEFLAANAATVKVAGPYLSEDGSTMTGSLLICEAPDVDSLRKVLGLDPYARAGLFESVAITPWKWVVGPTAA
jgi:uncharacterized protein YciI